MRRLILAWRAMFATLLGWVNLDAIEATLKADARALSDANTPPEGRVGPAPVGATGIPSATPPAEVTSKTGRSDAITLLAALQREARWLDLVQEDLDAYTDAQVGAAARDVLRGCRDVLQRSFQLKPVVPFEEGASVETSQTIDASRWHVSGRVTGTPPYRGRLVHHGWEAEHIRLPHWSGSVENARVVFPAEVEVV